MACIECYGHIGTTLERKQRAFRKSKFTQISLTFMFESDKYFEKTIIRIYTASLHSLTYFSQTYHEG